MSDAQRRLSPQASTMPGRGGPQPLSVSVAELRRAWAAAVNGQFRNPPADAAAPPQPVQRMWSPPPGERVVPVVGSAGSCGASTVALALACTADAPARVVECCPPTTAGLAAASTAELGPRSAAWNEGTRGDQVLLQRTAAAINSPRDVPFPLPAGQAGVTVVDVGWPPGQLTGLSCWVGGLLRNRHGVVAVSVATVPGLRRLEAVLPLLGPAVTAAVVGPSYRRWPAALLGSRGPGLRQLQAAGRLVVVPLDQRLALNGLDSTPLPQSLLEAARLLHAHLRPTADGGAS